MNDNLEIYASQREKLLGRIMEKISKDKRSVAAWLTGSFARHEPDVLSNLDLTVVVSNLYSKILCAQTRQVSSRTTRERYELFSLFGQPAILHENNNNAPEGGTTTWLFLGFGGHACWSGEGVAAVG
jgi:predicted nucleotidyltransferase